MQRLVDAVGIGRYANRDHCKRWASDREAGALYNALLVTVRRMGARSEPARAGGHPRRNDKLILQGGYVLGRAISPMSGLQGVSGKAVGARWAKDCRARRGWLGKTCIGLN